MLRRGCAALLAVAAAAGSARLPAARAQKPATEPLRVDPKAEELNDRGKALYSDDMDYRGAAAKFREAIAIQPDARYYYNLCSALEKLKEYREALDACDAVFEHEPREELATKTGKRAAQIRKEYREWRAERDREAAAAAQATTPATPPPEAPTPPAQNASNSVDEVEPANKLSDYGFGVGAEIGAISNGGVGAREHGKGGVSFRLHGDFLLAPRHSIGLSGYLQVSTFAERDIAVAFPLSIFDLGMAGYWHRHLWNRLYFTPLAGLHLSALATSNGNGSDATYGTLGMRLEGGLEWIFGDGRHVLKVTPISLNVYFAAGQVSGMETNPSFYGFDDSGVTWAFTVGYTIRFSKRPFPGWTLE